MRDFNLRLNVSQTYYYRGINRDFSLHGEILLNMEPLVTGKNFGIHPLV